jgi:hypothetical protein
MARISKSFSVGKSFSESPSFINENKDYLLKMIMNQLGMTEEDLKQNPSWVKAKVRDFNIDRVLEKRT